VVTAGAGVTVIARLRIGLEKTACIRRAAIIGANVVVITLQEPAVDASTVQTGIVYGAKISIVASPWHRQIRAAAVSIARIGGADILVVAIRDAAGDARPGLAAVAHGAGIVVCAGLCVGGILTTSDRVTRIVSTDIVVAAIEESTRLAPAIGTKITLGADIAIVADPLQRNKCTSSFRVARIARTRVVVLAVQSVAW